MSACQIKVYRLFIRVILGKYFIKAPFNPLILLLALFFKTLRLVFNAEALIRSVAKEFLRLYYSQNAIATPQNKPPLGSTTTSFEFNLDLCGIAARNLNKLSFDTPAGSNNAFIYNVADIKFNIDSHGMATRNLNELGFNASAGSNSAFIYNIADIKFNIDPYGMAIRNLSELGFDALAGSNSAFIYNAANIKFNIDPYGMATRNLSELGFDTFVGSNSAFISNAISFNFNLSSCSNLSIN